MYKTGFKNKNIFLNIFSGMVAHEFILDCRDFKKTANIEVMDIKRELASNSE
jgi:glycine dehydrogenase